MKKKDIILVGLFIIVGIGLFFANRFFGKKGETIKIYVDNNLYKSVAISRNQDIKINETNTVRIEDGKVFMIEANCPDKLCIKQGKISDSSKDIVCLPNRVVIRVEKDSDINVISE